MLELEDFCWRKVLHCLADRSLSIWVRKMLEFLSVVLPTLGHFIFRYNQSLKP